VREDSRLKCWKMMPMSRRATRSAAVEGSQLAAATSTLPAVGRFSRLMVRTSELLPAPLRPMMPRPRPAEAQTQKNIK
jgi:hypothetical protein